jgi:acyl-CoA synthetase (AMP-forming)/AMP-acid ligase II
VLAGPSICSAPEEARPRASSSPLNLPTTFWHKTGQGLTLSNTPLPPRLRLLVVGGEKADATAFARWQALGGDRLRWVNSYGPMETTVTATIYEPSSRDLAAQSLAEIPIGRPIANEEASGDKRLVAYVVHTHQLPPMDEELHTLLRGMLPRSLLPAVMVYQAALPLSPKGKVDRSALPPSDERNVVRAALAPRDELERDQTSILLRAWRRRRVVVQGIGPSPGA